MHGDARQKHQTICRHSKDEASRTRNIDIFDTKNQQHRTTDMAASNHSGNLPAACLQVQGHREVCGMWITKHAGPQPAAMPRRLYLSPHVAILYVVT